MGTLEFFGIIYLLAALIVYYDLISYAKTMYCDFWVVFGLTLVLSLLFPIMFVAVICMNIKDAINEK